MESIQEQETIATEIGTAVRHGAVYGLGSVLAKGIGFFMLPLYTHYLNPADYGVLEILDLSMSLFGMFLGMGMISALLRCYTGAHSVEQKRKIVSTGLLFVIVTGLVTFLSWSMFSASGIRYRPRTQGPSYIPLAGFYIFHSRIHREYPSHVSSGSRRVWDVHSSRYGHVVLPARAKRVFYRRSQDWACWHFAEFFNRLFRASYLAVRLDNPESWIGL